MQSRFLAHSAHLFICAVVSFIVAGAGRAAGEGSGKTPPVIYMIGDSTMALKNTAGGNPERGWGQLLPEYFRKTVKIEDRAKDGRSARSFRDERLWAPIVERLRPGDWVIIQFGHNDQKKDKPHAYADPATDYPELLGAFISEAREKGALPILVTPIYRRYFGPDGHPRSTAGAYPEAVRKLAGELGVPLVDLHEQTRLLLEKYGEESSKGLYLHFAPEEILFFPKGKEDNTHLSEEGARQVAGLFAGSLKLQHIPLADFLQD